MKQVKRTLETENKSYPVEKLGKLVEETAANLGEKLERFNDSLVKGFSKLLESPFKKDEDSGRESADNGDKNT